MKFFFFIVINIFFIILNTVNCDVLHRCDKIERTDIKHRLDSVDLTNYRQSSRTKRNLPPFNINLVPGNGLRTYPAAKDAFILASQIWTNIFHYNEVETNITIQIDLIPLRYGILGSTSIVNIIANCRRPDGVLPEPLSGKTGLTFPSCSQLRFDLPRDVAWGGEMSFSKAHLKVLGLYGLDDMFGVSDGQIFFSSRFARDFDFTISDGISRDKTDFLSVAIHEIGHLLGFKSSLDDVDYGDNVFNPTVLDLFRFDKTNNPGDFINNNRIGNPAVGDHIFVSPGLVSTNVTRFSRGMYRGDGNQASHWKADELTGVNLGIMDPSLAANLHIPISMNEIEVFRSLGYNIDITIDPIILYNYVVTLRNEKHLMVSIEYAFMDTVGVQYKESYYACNYEKETFMWKCPYPNLSSCDFRIVTISGRVSEVSRVNYFECRG